MLAIWDCRIAEYTVRPKEPLGITTEAYRMELKEFNVKMTTVAPGDFATNIAAGRYHAPLLEGSPYKANYGNTLRLMDEHVDAGNGYGGDGEGGL